MYWTMLVDLVVDIEETLESFIHSHAASTLTTAVDQPLPIIAPMSLAVDIQCDQ